MKTINSISGGKTSAFMAVHYPADHDVFACVLIDDPWCAPKDAGLVRAVRDKLGCSFIATAERDSTLRAVLDLEQKTGRQIAWVAGTSFDALVKKKKTIPSKFMRFCTVEMKVNPIMDYCRAYIAPVVSMRIGIRHDEQERAIRIANNNPGFQKRIVGKSDNGRNIWGKVEWRCVEFPLVEHRITHYEVAQWAKGSGIDFPADSNCVGCFWKPVQQLRKNWDEEAAKMEWFAGQERACGASFKDGITYDQVKAIGIQKDFTFGTGAGCSAGYCTD
jgi:hypothetical protein